MRKDFLAHSLQNNPLFIVIAASNMAADKKCSANGTKVLVFVPPKICLHQQEKKAKLDAQGKRLCIVVYISCFFIINRRSGCVFVSKSYRK